MTTHFQKSPPLALMETPRSKNTSLSLIITILTLLPSLFYLSFTILCLISATSPHLTSIEKILTCSPYQQNPFVFWSCGHVNSFFLSWKTQMPLIWSNKFPCCPVKKIEKKGKGVFTPNLCLKKKKRDILLKQYMLVQLSHEKMIPIGLSLN